MWDNRYPTYASTILCIPYPCFHHRYLYLCFHHRYCFPLSSPVFSSILSVQTLNTFSLLHWLYHYYLNLCSRPQIFLLHCSYHIVKRQFGMHSTNMNYSLQEFYLSYNYSFHQDHNKSVIAIKFEGPKTIAISYKDVHVLTSYTTSKILIEIIVLVWRPQNNKQPAISHKDLDQNINSKNSWNKNKNRWIYSQYIIAKRGDGETRGKSSFTILM